MKIKVLLLILVLSMTGCGGTKYAVKSSLNDQFADKSGPELITLEGNHIDFKDPMGIVPSSQLVPYLFRDNAGNITEMGFHLINVRSYGQWLNIRKGDEIVFLVNGQRISANASNTKIDHYTSGSNSYYYDYAWYRLTKEQMGTICNSTDIKIRIIGNDGIEEYGIEKKGFPINENFYSNNKKFFNEEVLRHKQESSNKFSRPKKHTPFSIS